MGVLPLPAQTDQRRWYIQQVLLHGRAEDIRRLDLEEVAALLPDLNLPDPIRRLWQAFLEARGEDDASR